MPVGGTGRSFFIPKQLLNWTRRQQQSPLDLRKLHETVLAIKAKASPSLASTITAVEATCPLDFRLR
jgi:hypothetical protein